MLQKNIQIYCKLRTNEYSNYCLKNNLQNTPQTQASFFELERNLINGAPNPVFVETMKYIAAYQTPVLNKSNMYSILRGPAYKTFLNQNNLQDNAESKQYFLESDMMNGTQPNPEFLKSMSYVKLMSDSQVRSTVESFISLKADDYQKFLAENKATDGIYTQAKFFTQQRENSKQPNSDFKQTVKVISVLKENLDIAQKYSQVRQNEYNAYLEQNGLENTPESVAKFFVSERELSDGSPNPVFKEAIQKVFDTNEQQVSAEEPVINNSQQIEVPPTQPEVTPQAEQASITIEQSSLATETTPQNVEAPNNGLSGEEESHLSEQPTGEAAKNNISQPNLTTSEEKIVPRQDFKNMSNDQLTAYVSFGINDNGPEKVPYLSGRMGSITEEIIPAAMEYLSRNPNLTNIELKDLNGINLNITKESTLEDLAKEWTSTMEIKRAEAQAAREETSVVEISNEMRAQYGQSYDLDGIAAGPNANEVLSDLPAFDNLAHGNTMTQEMSKVEAPVITQMPTTTDN